MVQGGVPPFGGGAAPAVPPPAAPAVLPGPALPPQPAGWSAAPQVGWQSAGPFGPQPGQVAGQMAGGGKQGRSKRKRVIIIGAAVLAILVLVGAGLVYYLYRSTAPTSYVIATDRGITAIDRIDLATRNKTVLISNKALPSVPDSVVFISDTQVLLDFARNSGEIGLGDIQSGTYTRVFQGQDDLRDMAVRPDGKSVLIADTSAGKILEYHVADRSVTTFVQDQNLLSVQGLAFDSDGNFYAAVGGIVYQLDPGNGKQIKKFELPGGSDGMAYDTHHNTLDIGSGEKVLALDPKNGKVSTLINGIGDADGVAIDRHGNLFIASNIGVLELNTDNQLLIVGTDSNGTVWDDVAPLSGSGAVNY
jgi:outer membrane protein assembly factor BamB